MADVLCRAKNSVLGHDFQVHYQRHPFKNELKLCLPDEEWMNAPHNVTHESESSFLLMSMSVFHQNYSNNPSFIRLCAPHRDIFRSPVVEELDMLDGYHQFVIDERESLREFTGYYYLEGVILQKARTNFGLIRFIDDANWKSKQVLAIPALIEYILAFLPHIYLP
jgi:hypothetical protein